jgi:hypothetical protein
VLVFDLVASISLSCRTAFCTGVGCLGDDRAGTGVEEASTSTCFSTCIGRGAVAAVLGEEIVDEKVKLESGCLRLARNRLREGVAMSVTGLKSSSSSRLLGGRWGSRGGVTCVVEGSNSCCVLGTT